MIQLLKMIQPVKMVQQVKVIHLVKMIQLIKMVQLVQIIQPDELIYLVHFNKHASAHEQHTILGAPHVFADFSLILDRTLLHLQATALFTSCYGFLLF